MNDLVAPLSAVDFRAEAHRTIFDGRSNDQRIPESDLGLIFNSKCCRNIDQSVLDRPTRVAVNHGARRNL